MANNFKARDEIRKYKKIKRQSVKGIEGILKQAKVEYRSAKSQYQNLKNETEGSYDKVIEALKDSRRIEKAISPGYRRLRKTAIASACIGFFWLGSHVSDYVKDMPSKTQYEQQKISGQESKGKDARKQEPNESYVDIIKRSVKKLKSLETEAHPAYRQQAAPSKALYTKPLPKNSQGQQNSQSAYWYFPVRGDTLGGIARELSGNVGDWRSIQKLNNLQSDLIEVNQPLQIPQWMAQSQKNLYKGTLDCKIYVVQGRESIQGISKKVYGTTGMQQEILDFNRQYNPRFSETLWNRQYVLLPK